MSVLALYSSRFGHTANIIMRVAQSLRAHGIDVEVRPVEAVKTLDPAVDAVILGASVRYGVFAPSVWRFAKKNVERLNAMPTAFIGVNLAAAKPEKSQPDTNAYVKRFLDGTPWNPTTVALFGGELDFRLYNAVDTALLKPILKSSGKPWGPDVHIDYTDWERVDSFADSFLNLIGAGEASAQTSLQAQNPTDTSDSAEN
ncbi:menaquinone-dependent protoporphyrinogen IX dehydrogenase [Schaalia sp. ZJ1691]|uniref:menaquinone-dependent protoporphyrinogen IX dehydrogenase n=1 Tax=Schaalia sp. ZJ1691 TaxID=2709404 RepID=UPI0013EB2A08|nr:menaquinone-dependent protoporphyrinogen IX dehydrogenase [Schaalia sp. ZJ1691]